MSAGNPLKWIGPKVLSKKFTHVIDAAEIADRGGNLQEPFRAESGVFRQVEHICQSSDGDNSLGWGKSQPAFYPPLS